MTVRTRQGIAAAVAAVLLVSGFGGGTAVVGGADNEPPLVDAGVDQEVPVNATVVLDAGDSRDPDGNIQSYEWRIETPDGAQATPGCPSCERTEFTVQQTGTYSATLTVTDDDGAERSDTMRIHVHSVDEPQVRLDGPRDVQINTSVEYTALMTAGDNSLVRVDWYVDGTRRTSAELEGGSATDSHTVRFRDNESHTITAQVYDVLGRTNQSSVSIDVSRPSRPCTNATWDGTALTWDASACGGGSGNTSSNSTAINEFPEVEVGDEGYVGLGEHDGEESVMFDDVTMGDPDGSIVDIEWEIVGEPSNASRGFYETTRETALLIVDAVGTYRVELTVEDDDGATADDTAIVNVGYTDGSGSGDSSDSEQPCYYPESSIFSCEEDSFTGGDGDTVVITDTDQDGTVTVNGTTYNVGTTGTSVRVNRSEWIDHYSPSLGQEPNNSTVYVSGGFYMDAIEDGNTEMIDDWTIPFNPSIEARDNNDNQGSGSSDSNDSTDDGEAGTNDNGSSFID